MTCDGQDMDSYLNFEDFNKSKYSFSAPSKTLLQEWLREVKGIIVLVHYTIGADVWNYWIYNKNNGNLSTSQYSDLDNSRPGNSDFATHHEALEKGLEDGLWQVNPE